MMKLLTQENRRTLPPLYAHEYGAIFKRAA